MKDILEVSQISEKYNLSYSDILNELLYFYNPIQIKEKYGYDINIENLDELEVVFSKHISENSEYLEIQDLVTNYSNKMVFINTPDGYKHISDFYVKKEINCLEIKTKDYFTKCSIEHEFEKDENLNWEFSKNLKVSDKIYTKTGFQEITEINNIGKSVVYDLRVSYIHRRYFSGNGISSHNCGKSFLCYSIVKEAQKKNWNTIYIDTEFSIEPDQLPGYGIDISTDKFLLVRMNVVEDIIHFMANLLDNFKEAKSAGEELPKTLIVLDSIGLTASRKENSDALDMNEKVDMSRAKKLASLFRIISGDLGYLNIPMICTNHVYEEMSLFPKKVMKGGCLVADNEVIMNNGTLKKIQDIEKGDYVQTLGGQQLVGDVHVFDNKKIYEIEFEDGTFIKCSENHRFLINEDYDNEENWVEIKDFDIKNIEYVFKC